MLRSATVLLALLLLGAGSASAASLRGELAAADAALTGDWALRADEGALDLAPALGGWGIAFEGASGWRVTREVLWIGTDPNARVLAPDQPTPRNETVAWGAGSLGDVRCGERCGVLLLATPGALLEVVGSGTRRLEALPEVARYAAASNTRGADDAFLFEAPPGWLRMTRAPTSAAQGDLVLFLLGATATLQQAGGSEEVTTQRTSRPETGPGGIVTGARESYAFYVVTLHGARLVGEPAEATLLAPLAQLRLDGAWDARKADGYLVVDGARREVTGESVEILGALDATVAAPRAARLAPLQGAPTTDLEGEATSVVVAGATVEGRSGLASVPVSAQRATWVALAVAALLWLLREPILSVLYTRLQRATLLRNPNRERVYQAIRARAGSSLADLVRETGMTQVVVRHHLRVLEQHRYIGTRGEGRAKVHFALDGSVDPARAGMLVTLKDDTRRAIAAAIAQGPRSQREIVEATGFSQRLVSYHLQKLEADGLVAGEGSMPRRYALAEAARAMLAPGTPAPTAA